MIERVTEWYREQRLLQRVVIGAVAGLAVILAFYGLWSLLLAFVKPHTVEQRTSFIEMVVGGLGGLTLIAGLLLTLRGQNKNQRTTLDQLGTAHEQLDLTRQGQITDRFTKAIDQLGKTDDNNPPDNKVEEVRLGGIYALEQIALDAPDKYHWPIMQVFAAYVRRYASWPGKPFQTAKPAADIQAILNAIGHRTRFYGAGETERLDLSKTDLSNYEFPTGAHLEGAILLEAHLEGATLTGAQLQEAYLVAANLQGAFLEGADLRDADLRGAHLEGAYLPFANLDGANLANAHLTGAYLAGAKIRDARNLDPASLYHANGFRLDTDDEVWREWNTEVDEAFRPAWWGVLPPYSDDRPLYSKEDNVEYSINIGKIPMHFKVDKGWYASLGLPTYLTLSPKGTAFTGSLVSFYKGEWVCDPQPPFAPHPAPVDMVDWFTNHHPHLTFAIDPHERDNPIGGAPGTQFDVEVNATDDNLFPGVSGPGLPVFPEVSRDAPYYLVKGNENRLIVLEVEGETLLIIIESPPNEFFSFCDRVEEVLAEVRWGE